MISIIMNDPNVPPGRIANELEHLGCRWSVHHAYRDGKLPPLSGITGLIVMGGAMGANDDEKHPFLTDLKKLIAEAVLREIPFLGICLGGQLLAASQGGKVSTGKYAEKGIAPVILTGEGLDDRLFGGIANPFISFQWHDDSFSIPPDGVRLAHSETCPNQAFRVGSCAWGTQFHPEVDEKIVREWSSWTKKTAAKTEEFVRALKRT